MTTTKTTFITSEDRHQYHPTRTWWRHTGTTLEAHGYGTKWKVIDDKVGAGTAHTYIRLCGHDIISTRITGGTK